MTSQQTCRRSHQQTQDGGGGGGGEARGDAERSVSVMDWNGRR